MNSFGMKLNNLGIHHVYCTDHILYLTCKKIIKSENRNLEELLGKEIVESLEKARAHVKFPVKVTGKQSMIRFLS